MVSGKKAKKRRPSTPVNIRRTGLPWLTIGAVTAVVALTAGIFTVVLAKAIENTAAEQATAAWLPSVNNPDPSTAIPGIYIIGASTPATGDTAAGYIDYQAASHVTADQRVNYNRFPPVGGPHDGEWANCNGIVYATAVRDENMVHNMEHGAVWSTYNPDTITPTDLTTLTGVVQGQPYLSLSPRPGLETPISLQAWAHQLKLTTATDERLQQFVAALRQNRWVHPENGATCQQPDFDIANPPPFDGTPPGPDAIPMTGPDPIPLSGAEPATPSAITPPLATAGTPEQSVGDESPTTTTSGQ